MPAAGTGARARAGDLLRDADAAMYRAKATGKNRIVTFDAAMHRAAVERLQLENDLRYAVERGQMVLHYQPIVSLQTREVTGFESLIRWSRDGTLVSPADFIPVAEDTGQIVPIGRWVVREACRQLRLWQDARPANARPLAVSVNLSRRQRGDPELVAHVARVLSETGVDPSRLKLEITESTIMEDATAAESSGNSSPSASGSRWTISGPGTRPSPASTIFQSTH